MTHAKKVGLLFVLYALTLSGCRHNVNTKNPQVVAVAALGDALSTCQTLEDSLIAANSAVEQIKTQEPEYYAHVKPLLQKISSANTAAAHKIQQAKNDGVTDWRTAFISISTSITPTDLTLAGVKNPNSKLIIGTSIAGIVAILQAIGGAQ